MKTVKFLIVVFLMMSSGVLASSQTTPQNQVDRKPK
jgi:hypothetical protein